MWNSIRETWRDLGKPIYTGQRLKDNLTALTWVSVACAILGVVMLVLNLVQHNGLIVLTSVAFILGGTVSAIGAGVLKKRIISVITPTLVCAVIFTYYALSGAAKGFALYWVMAMPIGMAYFVSVRYAIYLCTYYELLVCVLFYTPLRERMRQYYSDILMDRYPIVFLTVAALVFIAMVQYHKLALRDMAYTDRLNEEVERQTRTARERADQLEAMSGEMVQTLALSIDAKDRYTNGHSFRVSRYALALGRKLGLSEEELTVLEREALLHDIGKIGIPDAVLNKPGWLTPEEFAVVQRHAGIGGHILERSQSMQSAAAVARHHHERWDGDGYPAGLAGEDIPFHARIVAVADAYDAMRSDRVYRKGMDPEKIRRELERGRGSQFDPALAEAMLTLADDGTLDLVTEQSNALLSAQGDLVWSRDKKNDEKQPKGE